MYDVEELKKMKSRKRNPFNYSNFFDFFNARLPALLHQCQINPSLRIQRGAAGPPNDKRHT